MIDVPGVFSLRVGVPQVLRETQGLLLKPVAPPVQLPRLRPLPNSAFRVGFRAQSSQRVVGEASRLGIALSQGDLQQPAQGIEDSV
jgi:hypothetical protein